MPHLKVQMSDIQRTHLETIQNRVGLMSLADAVRYLISRDLDGVRYDSHVSHATYDRSEQPTAEPEEENDDWVSKLPKPLPVIPLDPSHPDFPEDHKVKFHTYAAYVSKAEQGDIYDGTGLLCDEDWQYCHDRGIEGPWRPFEQWEHGRPDNHPARGLLSQRDGRPWTT
jgi:hypothetical protein